MNQLLQSLSIHVDLAVEARDLVRGRADVEIPGVEETVEQYENSKVTTIVIKDPQAEAIMGKPMGTYVTIDAPDLKTNDPTVNKEVAGHITRVLNQMMGGAAPLGLQVLVVGLGNRHATPDALGPRVVEFLPVSRHLFNYAPEAIAPGMRSVAAISPGVLGTTGIETQDIVGGVASRISPQLIIIVDALAAQNADRIGTCVQIANTGIQPGGGVGNARMALTRESLGAPVISIGCPTVVAAAVIANQAIAGYCQQNNLPYNEQAALNALQGTLSTFGGSLAVTPKEVDEIIDNNAKAISDGIAGCVYPGVDADTLIMYS